MWQCVLQVLLARQIEQNAKDFAAWRKNRERELAQLRKQGRKQQMQARPASSLPFPFYMQAWIYHGALYVPLHTFHACIQHA